MKDDPNYSHPVIDDVASRTQYALQYALPENPPTIIYSVLPHADPMRTRHVVEIKSSIGVCINSLTGIYGIDVFPT